MPDPDTEPKPDPTMPTCPTWLNALAKARWKSLVPELHKLGVVTHIDGDAMAMYCQSWARWRKMEEFIEKNGETYATKDATGKTTGVSKFPHVTIARQMKLLLHKLGSEFGMTAVSRARISIDKTDEPEDPLEKLLKFKG